jgi:peptidoglycan/xylan/chitin deacetylase (PgdA/CDA1 family)
MPINVTELKMEETNSSWWVARKLFKDYNLSDYETNHNVNILQQWIVDNNGNSEEYKKGESIKIPADGNSVLQVIGISKKTTSKTQDEVIINRKSKYPEIYLTFDDGPNVDCTLNVVDVLNECKVKGSFFIQGQQCKDSVISQIKATCSSEYCEICNHTQSHTYDNVTYYPTEESFISDVKNCYKTLQKYYNSARHQNFKNVRCPGTSNWKTASLSKFDRNRAVDAVNKLYKEGFSFFGWDAEWKEPKKIVDSVETVLDKIKRKEVSGATKNKIVLLMHDQMFATESDKSKLKSLITKLKGKYDFKFISEY